jgi:hypothetical protein
MDVPDFIDRSIYLSFQIGTNRINSRQKLSAINQLEQWHRDEVIQLFISEVAYEESLTGADRRRLEKTMSHYYSETAISTSEERRQMAEIERILFPAGARTPNEKNDVEIVFNAAKYHAILVTNDGGSKSQPGGILGNRAALRALGINVMTGEEAVALVRSHIKDRDEQITRSCTIFRVPLPPWIGRD